MSQLFASGGQSTGASASAPVLLQSIQDWFLLILTGLISLLSNCSRHAIYPGSLSLGTTSPTSWGGLPAVMFLLHNPAPLITSDRFHGAHQTTMSVQLGKLASLSWGSVRNLVTLLVEIWKEGLQTPGSEALDLLNPHPFFPSLVIPWNAYSTMVSFQWISFSCLSEFQMVPIAFSLKMKTEPIHWGKWRERMPVTPSAWPCLWL